MTRRAILKAAQLFEDLAGCRDRKPEGPEREWYNQSLLRVAWLQVKLAQRAVREQRRIGK